MAQADPNAALIAATAAANTATYALVGTIITAIVSAAVALWSLRSNRRLQSHLKMLDRQTTEHSTALAHRLAEQKAEHDAERDYEYDARKRLYVEAEPLLFRLGEAAENALYRVISLARTTRALNLGSTSRSWLSEPGYYMASTIYNLLAPGAFFRLLQERLTFVDLGVAPRIQVKYLLAKIHYLSFTEDFALANIEPTLKYEPFVDHWKIKRAEAPAQYWRQGTNIGWVDEAVDSLLSTDAVGKRRVISFGEFQALFNTSTQAAGAACAPFIDLFLYFDPETRPVLWRILVLQAVTCRSLLAVLRDRPSYDLMFSQIPSEEELYQELNWRPDDRDSALAVAPIAAVEIYYRKRYPTLLEQIPRSNQPAAAGATLSRRGSNAGR
jgi:hypothetical protein